MSEIKIQSKAQKVLAKLACHAIESKNERRINIVLDEIDAIIKRSLIIRMPLEKNKTFIYSKDLDVFFSVLSKYGLSNLFCKSICNIENPGFNQDMLVIGTKIVTNLQEYMDTYLSEQTSNAVLDVNIDFNIRNLTVHIYKITLVLIVLINKLKDNPLSEDLEKILNEKILTSLIKLISSMISNYENMKYLSRDYLSIFYFIIVAMIIENRETSSFNKIINTWLEKLVKLNSDHLENYETHTYDNQKAFLRVNSYLNAIWEAIKPEKLHIDSISRFQNLLDEYKQHGFENEEELLPTFWRYPPVEVIPCEFKGEVERLVKKIEKFPPIRS